MVDSFRIFVPSLDPGSKPDEQPYIRMWATESLLVSALPPAGFHQVGPATCGWYHLWWRAWDCLTSIPGCYEGAAKLALQAVARVAEEVGLHAALIAQIPLDDGAASRVRGADRLVRRRVADRYSGYLTWILHNELKSLDSMLRPDHFEALFEPETAREFAADLRRRAAEHPGILDLFSEPETLTDAEADREKGALVEIITARRREIEWVLSSPDLESWRQALEGTAGLVPLEALLENSTASSISAGFRRLDMKIGSLHYQHLSTRLHGSTWSSALKWTAEGVFPNGAVLGNTDDMTESALTAVMWAAGILAIMKPDMGR